MKKRYPSQTNIPLTDAMRKELRALKLKTGFKQIRFLFETSYAERNPPPQAFTPERTYPWAEPLTKSVDRAGWNWVMKGLKAQSRVALTRGLRTRLFTAMQRKGINKPGALFQTAFASENPPPEGLDAQEMYSWRDPAKRYIDPAHVEWTLKNIKAYEQIPFTAAMRKKLKATMVRRGIRNLYYVFQTEYARQNPPPKGFNSHGTYKWLRDAAFVNLHHWNWMMQAVQKCEKPLIKFKSDVIVHDLMCRLSYLNDVASHNDFEPLSFSINGEESGHIIPFSWLTHYVASGDDQKPACRFLGVREAYRAFLGSQHILQDKNGVAVVTLGKRQDQAHYLVIANPVIFKKIKDFRSQTLEDFKTSLKGHKWQKYIAEPFPIQPSQFIIRQTRDVARYCKKGRIISLPFYSLAAVPIWVGTILQEKHAAQSIESSASDINHSDPAIMKQIRKGTYVYVTKATGSGGQGEPEYQYALVPERHAAFLNLDEDGIILNGRVRDRLKFSFTTNVIARAQESHLVLKAPADEEGKHWLDFLGKVSAETEPLHCHIDGSCYYGHFNGRKPHLNSALISTSPLKVEGTVYADKKAPDLELHFRQHALGQVFGKVMQNVTLNIGGHVLHLDKA